MPKGNTFAQDLLDHIFLNADIALIGDASGLQNSATEGSLYLSLHTADPGVAGDQTTSEVAYTGYARVAMPRNSTYWARTLQTMSNVLETLFPACTGAPTTTYFLAVGTASSGAGKVLYRQKVGTSTYPVPFEADTSDILEVPGLTLLVDDRVEILVPPGATIPGNLAEGVLYFVKTVSGSDITLALTSGGATIDITSEGSALIGKVVGLAITNLITPRFAAGVLAFTEW